MRAWILAMLLVVAAIPTADAGQGYCSYLRRQASTQNVTLVVGAGGEIGNCMCYMDPCVDTTLCRELYLRVGAMELANQTYDCVP